MAYACISKTQTGARCRNWASKDQRCSHHPNAEAIGPADIVDVKFNINPSWVKRLTGQGVEVRHPNFADKEAAHVAHAQQFGREAFRFRKDVADSGVPVFGEDGLSGASVYELVCELVEIYEIVDISIQPTRPGANASMRKLVIRFAHSDVRSTNAHALESLLQFLASSCWGHVHVWANPPRRDGKILDTVNISHREPDKAPECVLRFNNGLWAVEPAT